MTNDPRQIVLVVDDDEDIRATLCDVLEDEGYRVVEAPDGVMALALLRTLPSPAVIVTNHNMPRMDGPTLIELLTSDPALAQRHRVVYMTAGNRVLSPHLSQVLQVHNIPHLRKPFDLDVLVDAIRSAAAGLDNSVSDNAHG